MAGRIMIGLVAGVVLGLSLAHGHPEAALQASAMAKPIGKLWLSGLQMTVAPLVLSLVILAIANASDAASSGRVARRTLLTFVVLLCGFSAYSAISSPWLLELLPKSPNLGHTLRAAHAPEFANASAPSFADWLGGVIPGNAIMAAAQGAMLPMIVFALFFGFALTRIDEERRAHLINLFHAIADTMVVIVRWVLMFAPLGVFALVLVVCIEAGVDVIEALISYIVLLIVLYLGATASCYLIVWFGAGQSPLRFARDALPVQVVAASTQSSLASLPAMLDASDRLGYRSQVSALVLPMAVTLFRITSPIQYIAAACFIAWAYGIELSAMQLAAGAALAVVVSLGSVGLPGPVIFMATVLPVSQSMGLPLEPLALLLAVDTIPDVFATTGNVTGDLTATSLVDRHSREPESSPSQ